MCLQSDDAAELEWLSNFVEEETFSKEDLQKLHLLSGLATAKARGEPSKHPLFRGEVSVPGKARSKRARAGPSNWASQLRSLSTKSSEYKLLSVPEPEKQQTHYYKKRKGGGDAVVVEPNGLVRRCLHCDTDKTPQWRTGPKGPKTLCNACGVRYKSGRLVPSTGQLQAQPLFRQSTQALTVRSWSSGDRRRPLSSFITNQIPSTNTLHFFTTGFFSMFPTQMIIFFIHG